MTACHHTLTVNAWLISWKTRSARSTARLKELRPLVEEYQRLEAAAAALAGVGGDRRRRAGARRARRRQRRARPAAAGHGARGAGARRAAARAPSRRSSSSATQPGITIPELAEAMGIKQNYLYRVLPGLQKDGLVRKEGRGWHPLEAA